MKVSLGWLKRLLGGGEGLTGAEAARLLTRAGLEVEGVTRRGEFSGVIVAEVRGKRPHPDASKLTLVDVWDGVTVTQVVCGAPNVPEPGHRVLWAKPGSKLPMGEGGAAVEIQPKAVRGIESPGMLCAEDELGLGESHAGIIVIPPTDPLVVGREAAPQLGLPDEILELAVGANRPDCLGHVGVARELAAHLTLAGKAPSLAASAAPVQAPSSAVTIALEDVAGCPRYHATLVEGLRVGASPLADQLLLAALGVRAISNVVDVTNLAMLEHGQPLHAFDLDTLPGAAIRVRRARAGETIETLDGVVRELVAEDLLICDGADRAIALAGVMGGKATEVSASTTRLLLECACFDPKTIRVTAKRLGLKSEASHRFERGVDPDATARVAASATARLLGVAGGQVTAARDELARPYAPVEIALRAERCRGVTGLRSLSAARQMELLLALGIEVRVDPAEPELLRAKVPGYRPDLTREIDLIEEVLRLQGYDEVPNTVPPLRAAPPELKHRLADRVRDLLNALGLDEAITYAFVAPRELAAFGLAAPRDRALRIANPLREEQSALRTTLLPGLVRAAARNVAHGVGDVRLFEIGHIFLPANASKDGLPEERRHVAGILVGSRDAWLQRGEALDYFDLRGILDELGRGLGHVFSVRKSAEPWLHPGVQGALFVDAQPLPDAAPVGRLGQLHPKVAAALELSAPALVFEIDLSQLPAQPPAPLRAIPRYPAVERDFSFLVDAERSAAEIAQAIASLSQPLLSDFQPREDYRDPAHVPAGQKSMLWSFIYRAPDRTLTDAEVKQAHEQLVTALKSRLSLTQR